MIYSIQSQGWYIGITAASQAVKAGSTPVPCSKKERHAQACLSFLESVGDEKAQGQVNCPCANAFAQQKHFTAQKRRASTRRSASRLDSNYLTAEVNSTYNNSPLRCELTRDFARGTRGTLKCSGEINSPCANAYGAKAPKRTEWVRVPASIEGAGRCCRGAAMRDGVLRRLRLRGALALSGNSRWGAVLMMMNAAPIDSAGQNTMIIFRQRYRLWATRVCLRRSGCR